MDLTDSLRTIRRSLFSKNGSTSTADSSESIQLTIDNECDTALQKSGDDQCPVCLEKDVNTMLFPCSHTFHGDCILQWVQNNFSCPLCRTEITHFAPLKGQHRTELQQNFVKVWEKHYLEKADKPKDDFEDIKVQKTVAASRNQHASLSRTKSVAQFVKAEEIQYHPKCSYCRNCCSDNAFIYMAFDQKFCSTQCRLQYARKKPKKDWEAYARNTFYVEYDQVAKYI